MGRYYYDKKTETDELRSLDTAWLNSKGYFKGWYGLITWTSGSSINLLIDQKEPYARLTYTTTDGSTGEKKHYDYKVLLSVTPCQFGGLRYWFICPLSRPGVPCGRRVRILYFSQGIFGCRDCFDLTYSSRNVSQRFRAFSQALLAERDAIELQNQLKRRVYRGRPTRKRRQLSRYWYKARNSDKLWEYLEKRL